jgi:hypothetical protein
MLLHPLDLTLQSRAEVNHDLNCFKAGHIYQGHPPGDIFGGFQPGPGSRRQASAWASRIATMMPIRVRLDFGYRVCYYQGVGLDLVNSHNAEPFGHRFGEL